MFWHLFCLIWRRWRVNFTQVYLHIFSTSPQINPEAFETRQSSVPQQNNDPKISPETLCKCIVLQSFRSRRKPGSVCKKFKRIASCLELTPLPSLFSDRMSVHRTLCGRPALQLCRMFSSTSLPTLTLFTKVTLSQNPARLISPHRASIFFPPFLIGSNFLLEMHRDIGYRLGSEDFWFFFFAHFH